MGLVAVGELTPVTMVNVTTCVVGTHILAQSTPSVTGRSTGDPVMVTSAGSSLGSAASPYHNNRIEVAG